MPKKQSAEAKKERLAIQGCENACRDGVQMHGGYGEKSVVAECNLCNRLLGHGVSTL